MLDIETSRDHNVLGLSDPQVVTMYRTMLLARKLDLRLAALHGQHRASLIVSSAGHEGAQVGAAMALDADRDWTLPYYRDTALVLGLGMTAEQVLLSVLAKATDVTSGGRQMPGHWSDTGRNIVPTSSMIGTQFPHACGIAATIQSSPANGVVLVSSGEGATAESDFHEALNFASVQKLPVVFLIQNNLDALLDISSEAVLGGSVAAKARGYGVPGVNVNGNDVLAVYGAVSDAVDDARLGRGPTLVEVKTYRHYAYADDSDRTDDLVVAWRRNDPINTLRQYLVEQRILDEPLEAKLEEEITELISDALQNAEAAPEPTDAMSHVFRNPIEPTVAVEDVVEPASGEPQDLLTALNGAFYQIMEQDPKTVVFGEEVGHPGGGAFGVTEGLTAVFDSDRIFSSPQAESLVVGVAIGMACSGAKPIAEIQFADFSHAAFNQIVSEAARISYRTNGVWSCPLVIRMPYGGGINGGLYHSQSVEAFYTHVPGLKVVVPSTPADAQGLLLSAVDDPDPVIILEPKALYREAVGPVPNNIKAVPIGQAAVRRMGYDLTILAYGTMAHYAVEAAEELAQEDIDCHVIDLRTLQPLDWPTIEAAVVRNGKVLIVHEDNEFGGLGAEIAAQIGSKAFDLLDAPVERYCAPMVPAFPYNQALAEQVMPSKQGIIERARKLAAV